MSERIGREKIRKPVSHDKDRLVSERKGKNPASGTNTVIHQPHKQTSAQKFSRWYLPWKWKDKILLLLLLSQKDIYYCWAWYYTIWTIPFVQLDSTWVVSALHIVLLQRSYRTGSGKRGSLGSMQALLSNKQKAGMLSTLF